MMWIEFGLHNSQPAVRLNSSSGSRRLVVETIQGLRMDCGILEAEKFAADLLTVAKQARELEKLADVATREEAEHAIGMDMDVAAQYAASQYAEHALSVVYPTNSNGDDDDDNDDDDEPFDDDE